MFKVIEVLLNNVFTDVLLPVLKHGPRSLTIMQVFKGKVLNA